MASLRSGSRAFIPGQEDHQIAGLVIGPRNYLRQPPRNPIVTRRDRAVMHVVLQVRRDVSVVRQSTGGQVGLKCAAGQRSERYVIGGAGSGDARVVRGGIVPRGVGGGTAQSAVGWHGLGVPLPTGGAE